jgi:hypothetical protein
MINPVLDLATDTEPGAGGAMDQTCWCRTEADALIVTPSYSKNYGNLHLQAIWRDALEALALAEEWMFVGYSLPNDDFAIPALVARALAWKRSEGVPAPHVRVFDWAPLDVQEMAKAQAESGERTSDAPPPVHAFAALAERFRSILAGARLDMNASGLDGAAAWVEQYLPRRRR